MFPHSRCFSQISNTDSHPKSMLIAIYLKIRLYQIIRLSQQIGIFRLIFVLCCLCFLCTALYLFSNYYYLPALFFVVIYRYQCYRRDKPFIKQTIRHSHLIYWIDYTIFAIFLMSISIIKGYYLDLLLYPIIILITPFLFNTKIRIKALNIPFFRKGSYEYKSMFRRFYPIIFLLYILSFIGLYNNNERVLYFCCIVSSVLWLSSLIKAEIPIYIFNYSNSRNLIQEKTLNIIFNTGLLYSSFLLIALLGGWETICFTMLLLVNTLLMTIGSNILKYCFNNNELITGLLVASLLIPLFIMSMIYPLFIILYLALDIFIIVSAMDKLDLFFNHDNNTKFK